MNAAIRKLSWLGAAVVTVAAAAVVIAQERVAPEGRGSLAAMTSEVRQLRLAVEELARSQTQAQALGVYLSAQQSRLLQVSSRLEAARRELEAASLRLQQVSIALASLDERMTLSAEPEHRMALEHEVRQLKQEQAAARRQEQRARGAEAELAQALHAEEARWSDLTSRLEALLRP